MIHYVKGNLLGSDSEAIVNTVNCVGVMGRGIALQFKKSFPDNFTAYENACKQKSVIPGKMFVYETGRLINPKYIINFPTKRHWREASRIEDIEAGLTDLVNTIKGKKITSVSIPPLGCGLGGLDWGKVKNKMESALLEIPEVEIEIFEPDGTPDVQSMARNRKIPQMTPGRAALVGLMVRYLGGLLDPFITLLEIHKLLYFLQNAGEPLKLNYIKAQYGPYADNLRHVLNAVEGYLVSGYADGGDDPTNRLQLIAGAKEEADAYLEQHQETCNRMGRVEKLVDGFETPFGLELLATVYWIINNGSNSIEEVITETYAWNDRKKQFSKRQIEVAYNRLSEQGWIA